MFFKYTSVVALCLLAGGCASLSKSECQVGDWYGIGKNDGYQGYPAQSRTAEHYEACSKHGVAVDLNQYNRGHAEGLASYCTFPRGLSEGKAGRSYKGVCLGKADTSFRSGHAIGMEYHRITSRIASLRRENSLKEQKLRKVAAGSADFYRIDGEIKANLREISLLGVQQGQVEERISSITDGPGL